VEGEEGVMMDLTRLVTVRLAERYEMTFPLFQNEPPERLLLSAGYWARENPPLEGCRWQDLSVVVDCSGGLWVTSGLNQPLRAVLLGIAEDRSGFSTTLLQPLVVPPKMTVDVQTGGWAAIVVLRGLIEKPWPGVANR
jgi:hypothetical protein